MAAIFPGGVVTDAQLGLVANGSQTTLNGSIDNSQTTITVVDTTSFAASGFIVIDTEVIQYTSKNSTQFLGCTRGADSSAAASHTTTTSVFGYFVAANITNLQLEVKAIETLLGSSSQNVDLSGRAGFGITFKSPDGTITRTIGLDNNGNFGIIS